MTGPHTNQPVLEAGAPLDEAQAVMITIHGRGASAGSILELAEVLSQAAFAYRAPQAAGSQWYPQSFLAPLEQNEPGLSSGLAKLDHIVASLGEQGFPPEKIILLGFSQGACLALEYAARNARRYGGVVALSGGLIGPPGTPRDYAGSLDGTPIFIGCSDTDFHIPLERVRESTATLTELGAQVDERIYPGMGHMVNEDELAAARVMMAELTKN